VTIDDPRPVEGFLASARERQSQLIGKVMDLEKSWPLGETGDTTLEKRARFLLDEAAALSREISSVFLKAPVTALGDARFGWTAYEIANARLNLTYLIFYGENAVKAEFRPISVDDLPNAGEAAQ
jgi:hypothetical protein